MPVAADDVVWLDVLPSMGNFRSTLQTQAGQAATGAGQAAGTSFTSNFAKHLKVAAVLGGALAVGGAFKFMQEATREASNLGESINAVNVTFGTAAGGILDLGKKAAESVGLSQSQFNGLAVQFSAFATVIAGKGGDVTSTMKDLTTRGADFASVMNLDVNEAMGLFQSGLAGETEPLRKYGIDLSAAAVENYALAHGIVKAGEEMTEQQKVQARYGSLMEQTSKVQGDFTNTSDSLANSQRILGARFDDIQAQVGAKVIPILEKFSGWVLTVGLPALQEFGGWIQDNVLPVAKDLFENLKTGAETVLPKLGTAFGVVSDAVMATVGFFQEHETAAKVLMGTVAVVAGLVAGAWVAQGVVSVINAAKAVGSWFAVATASTTSATIQSRSTAQIVVGWIAAAAGATINAVKIVAAWAVSVAQTGILMAMYAAQSIGAAATSAAAWVGAQIRTVASLAVTAAGFVAQGIVMVASMAVTAAGVVASWVVMGVQSLIQAARMAAAWLIAMGPVGWVIAAVIGLVAIIIANWDTVKKWTIDIWNAVTGFIKDAASAIWSWVTEKFTALKDGVVAIFTAVRDVVMAIWNGFKDAVIAVVTFLVDAVVWYYTTLWKGVVAIFTFLRDGVMAIWNGFRDAVIAVASWIWDRVVWFFNTMKSGVINIYTGIRDTVVGVWNGLRDAVVGTATNIWNWVVEKFTNLKNGAVGIFQGIRDTIKGIWDGLLDVVKAPIRIAFDFVNNNMIGPVNSILDKFPGNLKIPTLPHLREGGLLRGPGTGTSDSILGIDPRTRVPTAAVSNGEYVVKAKRVRQVGVEWLDAFNSGRLPGLATGGLAGRFGVPARGLGGWLSDRWDDTKGIASDVWDGARNAVSSVKNFATDMLAKGARAAASAILGPIRKAVTDLIPDKVPMSMLEGGVNKLFDAVMGKGDEQDKLQELQGGSFSSSSRRTPNGVGGLGPVAAAARRDVMSRFGLTNIGGYSYRRIAGTNTLSDHATGHAIDVMIPNYKSAAGIAKGNQVANYFTGEGSSKYPVKYIIWNDRINSGSGWKPYGHPGGGRSDTLQHRDHDHVSFYDQGGLWPSGRMGINLTGGVERVLTPPQDNYFRKFVDLNERRERAASGDQRPVNLYTPDIPHAIRALRAEQQEREALAPTW